MKGKAWSPHLLLFVGKEKRESADWIYGSYFKFFREMKGRGGGEGRRKKGKEEKKSHGAVWSMKRGRRACHMHSPSFLFNNLSTTLRIREGRGSTSDHAEKRGKEWISSVIPPSYLVRLQEKRKRSSGTFKEG